MPLRKCPRKRIKITRDHDADEEPEELRQAGPKQHLREPREDDTVDGPEIRIIR